MKRKVLAAVQIVIAAGLIVLILARMENKSGILAAFQQALCRWPFLFLGISFFGVCISLVTMRWVLILELQGIRLSLRRAFLLYLVGQFFNSFLIGVTGGDIVKAYYVTQETHGKKTEAVSSVFIDRILGLLPLIGLAIFVMLVRLRFFLTVRNMKWALIANVVLLIAAIVGFLLVFRQNIFERYPLFRKLRDRYAVGPALARAYAAFHACVNHPVFMIRSTILSLLNHVWGITSVYYIGKAVGVDLPFFDYLAIFLVVNMITAVPLTPGGMGMREALVVSLLSGNPALGGLGVPAATAFALSLMVYATMALWSLVGSIAYVFYAISLGRPHTLPDSGAPPPVSCA